ncbi:MAG: M23 family metallopeptidase [Actinomycetota bacterium]|nr:M23 family metallopeptidase [Actinomycetota bacterium]
MRRTRLFVLAAAAIALAGACESPPPSTTTTVPAPTVRPMTFPVLGGTSRYIDTYGAARSGGRSHQGQDLMGAKMTHLIAANDGTVTALRHDSTGLSGNSLTITDAAGWKYVYIHINNDRPGTDDGANIYDQAFAPGLRRGSVVKAGDLVAYMGDSGNAENAGSHLHFELHRPDGTVVNAYPSLTASTVVK